MAEARRFLRFRGKKTDTWDVEPLVQIGPDVDRDTGAAILREQAYSGYFAVSAYTGQGLTCTAGQKTGTLKFAIAVAANQLVDQYGWLYAEGRSYKVTANTAGAAGDVVTITVSEAFAASRSSVGIVFTSFATQPAFCSKAGSESNTGAAPWVAKLLVQSAIDFAVASSSAYAIILDSGVYTECLDLKGVNIYAASGKSPTIQFPVVPFGEAATGLTVATYQLAEFTYNGVPCVYAAAADGLYRSLDGKAWTKVLLSGHVVRGCCVWGDSLYAISATDKAVYKVVASGTMTTFATAAASGIDSSTVNGGIFAIGSRLFVAVGGGITNVYAVWYDGTWHTIHGVETTIPVQIIYDPEISTEYAFARHAIDGGGFMTFDMTNLLGQYYTAIKPLWLSTNAGKLYAMTTDGIMSMPSGAYPDIWTTSVERGPWYGYATPRAIFWDDFGYLVALSTDDVFISRDDMGSFASYGLYGRFFSSIVTFQGVDVAGHSTGIVVWDRRHIASTTAAKVNGVIMDGSDHAVYTYAGPVSLEWFRATGYYSPCSDTGHTATHKYGRFADIVDTSFSGKNAAELVLDHVEFATASGCGLRVSGPNVRVKDCTVAASSRGLILDAVPLEVTRSIFSGNVIDVEANVSGAALASCCYETHGGYTVTDAAAGSLPVRYAGNPLFVDDSGADLRLKSRALGYQADSWLLANVAAALGDFDMRESIGARRYSRALAGSAYGVDYMALINPSSIMPAWQPAGYQKSISATGSLYGSETNAGAHKVSRKLAWNGQATSIEAAQLQAAWLRYIYSLDSAFDVGETTTGADWYPRLVATKGASATFNTLAVGGTSGSPPNIAPNQYAGAWCENEDGDVIGRIVSHGAPVWDGVTYNQYVIAVVWATDSLFPADTTTCNIDVFRRYRIDKSQSFAPSCQVPYAPGLIPEIPSQYDLTLCEVDE